MSAEHFSFWVGDSVHVGGQVEWGDGGWLVTNNDNRFQAPNEMGKNEAVLTWLRQVLGIDGPDHTFKPGTSVDGGPPSDLWCDVCGESRAKAHRS